MLRVNNLVGFGAGGGAAAAFPVVEATNTSDEQSAVASHGVDLPTSITAGDVLLAIFAHNTVGSVSWPGGWTELFDTATSTGGDVVLLSAAWRTADGGEGSSITVTSTQSARSAHNTYRFSGASSVEHATATGTGDDPNPPNLTPSWGSKKTLWIAACGISRPATSLSANPSSYGNGLNETANLGNVSTDVRCASARRELQAASENPGAFDINTGDAASDWVAATFGIEPG